MHEAQEASNTEDECLLGGTFSEWEPQPMKKDQLSFGFGALNLAS